MRLDLIHTPFEKRKDLRPQGRESIGQMQIQIQKQMQMQTHFHIQIQQIANYLVQELEGENLQPQGRAGRVWGCS